MDKTTRQETEKLETLMRSLAPEDIRRGAYVAVLQVTVEVIPFICDDPWRPAGPRRFQVLPGKDAGTPLKVREVCLPYILVQHPDGKHRTIDVRRYRLGLLSGRFAEKAFKKLAAALEPPAGTT